MDPLNAPGRASLAPASRSLLRSLAPHPWCGDLYLAGSAALALHLGHRPVRDLDLMSATNRLRGPSRRDLLEDLRRLDPGLFVETAHDGFLYVRSAAGVALRFYYYPYPLVAPEATVEGVAVAALPDLGLMKLAAIISRGTRRDLLDLHAICRCLPLATLLELSGDKFGHVRDFPLQALKALSDLPAAEDGEPLPATADGVDWPHLCRWIRQEVRRIGRSRLGLRPAGVEV